MAGNITHIFDYLDQDGKLVAQKRRIEKDGGKDFVPRTLLRSKEEIYNSDGRYDRDGAKYWAWGLREDLRGLLYNLPDLLDAIAEGAPVIYWCEGERDADAVADEGEYATTSIQNGYWAENVEHIKNYKGTVVVLVDNDPTGAYIGLERRQALVDAGIKVRMMAAHEGKDVRDHLESGLKLEQLKPVKIKDLRERAAEYKNSPEYKTYHPISSGPIKRKMKIHTDEDMATEEISTSAAPKKDKKAAKKRVAVKDRDPSDIHRGHTRMAYRFEKRYKGKILHVRGIGWFWWTGRYWKEDKTGYPRRALHRLMRETMAGAVGDKDLQSDVNSLNSASGQNGALQIAADLLGFAKEFGDLDPDPWLLNCQNGTLDLRTMELRPHDPKDLITKITRASYDPTAHGESWSKLLKTSLPDEDVREFLQRFCGYALKGVVEESVLPILHGLGHNGKTKFYEAVKFALGTYAHHADPELFIHRPGAHPTGKMDLQGKRFVTVSETEADARLALVTVKNLTGGDEISARRMRADFVTFKPSHSIILVTNHLPKVEGDDPAVWRRLRVVPFDVIVPEDERDAQLGTKLEAEADAILAWCVEGLRAYEELGRLAEPENVKMRTNSYRSESDFIRGWIDDNFSTGLAMSITTPLAVVTDMWNTGPHLKGGEMKSAQMGNELRARGYIVEKGAKNVTIVRGMRPAE